MPTVLHPRSPVSRWLVVAALVTLVLLSTAWLLHGIGAAGVTAAPDPGAGGYIRPEVLTASEQVAFARADRAISRLRLGEDGNAVEYEAYGDVLQVLSEILPASRDAAAIRRAKHLLRSSLPEGAGQELANLLSPYLRYRHLEQSMLELIPDGAGNAESAWVQLRLQYSLRRAILGEEVAGRLYETAHRMTELHLVRQLIMQREDLDDDQKQRLIRREALMVGQGSPEEQR